LLFVSLFPLGVLASPQARLVYGRAGAAVDRCPDEAALRRAVAARIGYDPFFPSSPIAIVATFTAKNDLLIAHIRLIDEQGNAKGVRELHAAKLDCQSLFETVALTISIAIDPQALARQAAPPPVPAPAPPSAAAAPSASAAPTAETPPPPEPESRSHAEAPAPVAAREPESPPSHAEAPALDAAREAESPPSHTEAPALDAAREPESPPSDAEAPALAAPREAELAAPAPTLRLGVAVRGSLGLGPGLAAGTSLHADAAWHRFSLRVEAEADFPSTSNVDGNARVTGWSFAGALLPCARFAPLVLCGVAVLGRFDATARGVLSPEDRAAFTLGLGARAGVEVPVTGRLSLVAQADVLGNVIPTTLAVGVTDVWTASPVAGVLGIGALMSF
jgi:hypothetical protein